MLLIRMTFWLGLVVLLMPTDERQQDRFYATAAATVERAATFCERNVDTCAAAGEAWETLVKKAQFAGRMAVQLAKSRGARDSDMMEPAAPERHARPLPQAKPLPTERGTLAPADLAPAWRGQLSRAAG
jgi:hypothetical protein